MTAPARLHGAGCDCTRCVGFEVGNQAAVGHGSPPKHGAYSRIRLSERTEEQLEWLRTIAPVTSEADEPVLEQLAIGMVRAAFADAALAQVEERAADSPLGAYIGERLEVLTRLRQDSRAWSAQVAKFSEMLGMSARSRAALGLQIAQLQRFDRERLTAVEQGELRRLLVKGGAVLPEERDV